MAGLFIHETQRFAFNLRYKIVTYKTQIISSPQLKSHENFSFHIAAVISCFDRV